MSLSYKLLGKPKTSEEVIDKLIRNQVDKLDIKYGSTFLDEDMTIRLATEYQGKTRFGKDLKFNFKFPGSFNLYSLAGGYKKDLNKLIDELRTQVDILKEKGIDVTVYECDQKTPTEKYNLN